MTIQSAWSLASTCFGFIAAIYFCIGAAFLNHKKILKLGNFGFDWNRDFLTATASQSAQYATGALLLIGSFLLQVVATLTTSTIQITLHPVLSQPIYYILLLLSLIGVISYLIYRSLFLYTERKIEKDIAEWSKMRKLPT